MASNSDPFTNGGFNSNPFGSNDVGSLNNYNKK